MSQTAAPHSALFDVDPDAIRCPYPHWAAMREAAPVYPVPELGFLVVTRHADVLAVARNPEVFSSQMPTGPQVMQQIMTGMMEALQESEELRNLMGEQLAPTPVLLTADPPLHDRQRALVNRAFGPRRVASMEAGIRIVAEALADDFAAAGRVELVSQFAVTLPLIVIADALGVPREELATFKRWSDDFVVAIGNHKLSKDRLAEMMRSQLEFAAYFTGKIAERQAEPRDDLITDVVQARIDGTEPLSTGEMTGMFSQFLVAGNETTTKLIASGMLLLCRHPDVLAEVRADRSLLPGLVEEVLRLESPVQGLFRTALVDTEVGGVPVKAGTHLLLAYASANRDGAEFPQPDDFDVRRPNAKLHLAFGQGPHYCIGATLARAEGRIAFDVLLDRLDDIALVDGTPLAYEDSYVLHGLKELHLTFRPAVAAS